MSRLRKSRRNTLLIMMALFLAAVYFLIFDKLSLLDLVRLFISSNTQTSDQTLSLLQFRIVQMVGYYIAVCLLGLLYLRIGVEFIYGKRTFEAGFYKQIHKVDQASLLLILVLFLSFPYRYTLKLESLYAEDGLLEYLTAIGAVGASILFLISSRINKDWTARLILIGLALLFFIFGMEELSWGQRIFGWETSNAWGDINYQDESNLHNLLNPLFWILYPVFNNALAAAYYFANTIKKKLEAPTNHASFLALIPQKSASLYAIVFSMLILQSLLYGGELTEEVVSVVGLSYALKQVLSPGIDPNQSIT